MIDYFLKILDLNKSILYTIRNYSQGAYLPTKKYIYSSRLGSILRINYKDIVYSTDEERDGQILSISKVGENFYALLDPYGKDGFVLKIYSPILELIKKIDLKGFSVSDNFYFTKDYFLVDGISSLSKYDYNLNKLATLQQRDFLTLKDSYIYTLDEENNIKIYDENLSFVKKIPLKYKERIYATKAKIEGDILWLYGIDNLFKVDLKNQKILGEIKLNSEDEAVVGDKIYISRSKKIDVYDKDLKFLKSIVFKNSPIEEFKKFKDYFITLNKNEIKIYKNKKLIKKFTKSILEPEFLGMDANSKILAFVRGKGSDSYYLNIYNLKTKKLQKIAFHNKGWFRKVLIYKNKVYMLFDNNIIVYNKKLIPLHVKATDMFVTDTIYVIKNSKLYKFQDVILQPVDKGIYEKNRGIFYSSMLDSIVLINGKKRKLIPTNKRYKNFILTPNYFLTHDAHNVYVFDNNFTKTTYKITDKNEIVTFFEYIKPKLYISTDFGRIEEIELK